MTFSDNPFGYFFAFIVLSVLFFLALRNRRRLLRYLVIIVAAGAAVWGGIYFVDLVGGYVYRENLAAKCLTAHERREQAEKAPKDYWGDQLRSAAREESKKCEHLATELKARSGNLSAK